ncbi:MAG: hypothetical protein CVV02_06835 [Firmicutes bacterium HGW-Firmicutes-7]|nr:MAG: hypothetical protein CVV02_06835 [Firmicutes bacterium HGW-Firmicutes-7]
MVKEKLVSQKLSQKQAISIIVMFIMGTAMISGVGKEAEENAWIAIALAGVMSSPIYLMYAYLLKTFKNKNIYDINVIVFGKHLGIIFSIIFTWNGIYLSAILIRKVAEFMNITGLNETPIMMIMLMLVLVSIYMIKKGILIFGKWCQFYICIVVIVVLFEVIFLTPSRELDVVYPVMYNGFAPVMQATIHIIAFPMVQVAHLLGFLNELDTKASYTKVFMYGLLIGTVILIAITFDNITVLGPKMFSKAYYPSYLTFRQLSVGDFIRRIEILSVLMFLIVGFVKYTATLFSAVIGLKHVFNLNNYYFIIVPVAFVCSILAFIAYEDLLEVETLFYEIYTPYSLVINGLLPILIYITYLARSKLSRKEI